jgi:hypothetical protein
MPSTNNPYSTRFETTHLHTLQKHHRMTTILPKTWGLLLLALLLATITGGGVAHADDCSDMPSPWDTASCVCQQATVCDHVGGTVIECEFTEDDDVVHAMSSGNDPIIWGVCAAGEAWSENFCCDAASGDDELDDDTHELQIDVFEGDDKICLHDQNHLWCSGAMSPAAAAWPGTSEINGGLGADSIDTAYGSMVAIVDGVSGGSGADVIYTYLGDDEITGGDHDDWIAAGGGDDTVEGGDGDDIIYGEDDDDLLKGGDGADKIYGGGGDDTIILGNGGPGDGDRDMAYGGANADCICAGETGPGNNQDLGYDTLVGDFGNDTCDYVSGAYDAVNCETPSSVTTCTCL